jgi:hypothetical protein
MTKRRLHLLTALVLTVLLLPGCCAKIWRGTVELGAGSGWYPLTSFAFSKGVGMMKAKSVAGELTPRGTEVAIYIDDVWEEMVQMKDLDCAAKLEMANWKTSISWGDPEDKMTTTISQSIRPHMWYVVVANCHLAQHGNPGLVQLTEVELSLVNDAKGATPSHLSHEQQLPAVLMPGALLACLCAGAYIWVLARKKYRESGVLHPTVYMLITAFGMQTIFVFFDWVHLRVYADDGIGATRLSTAGWSLHWLSQLVTSYVIIGLAYGWTLRAPRRSQTATLIKFCGPLLAAFQVLCVILGKSYEGTLEKMHALDSWPMQVLILLRLIMLCIFVSGCFVSLTSRQYGHASKEKIFFRALLAYGSAWFAALPITALVTRAFPPYLQHQLVTVGVLATQTAGLAALSNLFLTQNSYYKIPTLSSTLPLISRRYLREAA